MPTRSDPPEDYLLKGDKSLATPDFGPSDTSDSGSDMPASRPDVNSDSASTGERASVENIDDETSEDVSPDEIVDAREAGVSQSRPDPVRNGG